MKKYLLSLLSFLLFFVIFTGKSHADTLQLNLQQLTSNGNGKVTFQIVNPPSDFDFNSITAAASWDNANWVYAVSYQGGCPNACAINWQGTGVPFYIKLSDQNSSIIFNQSLNGGAFSTLYTQLNLQQLSSDGTGGVIFKILNPPPGFDFSSLSAAGASWDNTNWVYAVSYQGGCPDACEVHWAGQTTNPFYVKLANETTSIIFNQSVSPVLNVAPIVGTIAVSTNPVVVNNAITTTATFTDSGVSDTHTASWNWGDGNTTTGTVTESNGTGSVTDTHTYTQAGVYTISLTITDNSGASGTNTFQYISVYNPTPQGLFSGARIFDSPVGAYSQNTSLTGKVMFGVSVKYNNNQPTGNVNMSFKSANVNFVATAINSLVTSNGMATVTGSGTVNGNSGYTFFATGLNSSQGGPDIRFQIKDSSNNVIYDSQPGAPITSIPTTSVTGNIVVH
ncbi:MAG TPA: PKD domain-containing protein [Candidatus Saccharimonadales bacterium]|nr:PKD domain-containing protein [Candidatus Saccharimonadales bacterium]